MLIVGPRGRLTHPQTDFWFLQRAFDKTRFVCRLKKARFLRAEKNVKELNLSVDLMKKESRKLLERAALAEKDMKHGQSDLMNAGTQIQRLAKSVTNVEVHTSVSKWRMLYNRRMKNIKTRCSVANYDNIGDCKEITK
ncbi:hypothetical protein CsSME_00042522 [Camellia sinensis var. sinensis]